MNNPNKVGLLFAALFALWHLVWIALVIMGWAQPIIDFIFWAHMIQPVYVIKAFNIGAAFTLIVISGVIGYTFGFFGALIWSRLHRA